MTPPRFGVRQPIHCDISSTSGNAQEGFAGPAQPSKSPRRGCRQQTSFEGLLCTINHA